MDYVDNVNIKDNRIYVRYYVTEIDIGCSNDLNYNFLYSNHSSIVESYMYDTIYKICDRF